MRRRRVKMPNKFTYFSPACLRARYRNLSPDCLRARYRNLSPAGIRAWFRNLLIVAALCLNYPLLSDQAASSLSDSESRHTQLGQFSDPLSDSGSRVSLNLTQSQAGQNPPGQDQPIRIKTELINLRAVVTDKRGQSITDLKKEDFELMENGKPQEVSFFSIVKIPGRGEVRQPENTTSNVTPDVPARTTRPAETIGRTVLLYVDTLHLSPQSLLSVKQSLRKFIDE